MDLWSQTPRCDRSLPHGLISSRQFSLFALPLKSTHYVIILPVRTWSSSRDSDQTSHILALTSDLYDVSLSRGCFKGWAWTQEPWSWTSMLQDISSCIFIKYVIRQFYFISFLSSFFELLTQGSGSVWQSRSLPWKLLILVFPSRIILVVEIAQLDTTQVWHL